MKKFSLLIALLICVGAHAQFGSKERLYKGYFELNSGLEMSRSVLSATTDKLYYDLTFKYSAVGDSAVGFFAHGMAIRDTAQSIIRHINFLKVLLIAKVEDKTKTEIEGLDTMITMYNVKNYEEYLTPMSVLFPSGKSSFDKPYTIDALQMKLSKFRNQMNNVWRSDDEDQGIDLLFETSTWSWEKSFKNKPLIAILAMLSKIQLDVKLQEIAAIQGLIRK